MNRKLRLVCQDKTGLFASKIEMGARLELYLKKRHLGYYKLLTLLVILRYEYLNLSSPSKCEEFDLISDEFSSMSSSGLPSSSASSQPRTLPWVPQRSQESRPGELVSQRLEQSLF